MSVEYEIRATPVIRVCIYQHIRTIFTVATVGGTTESKILIWMLKEVVDGWGLKWPAEGQQVDLETAKLVTRLGLGGLLDLLRRGEKIPENMAVGVQQYGDTKPKFAKECAYLDRQRQEYSCKAAVEDDPWGGVTTELLCDSCQMPDGMLVCSRLVDVKTSWVSGDTEYGVRKVVEASCAIGNTLRTGAHCMPGVRGCWVYRICVF